MRAGDLRHRVNLLRMSTTKGSYGEDVISWTTDKTVWGAIWPLRGSEYFSAQQISSVITHKVRIRYTTFSNTTAIGPKHRIETKDGARIFEIVSPPINADEGDRYLDIFCKEAT